MAHKNEFTYEAIVAGLLLVLTKTIFLCQIKTRLRELKN